MKVCVHKVLGTCKHRMRDVCSGESSGRATVGLFWIYLKLDAWRRGENRVSAVCEDFEGMDI